MNTIDVVNFVARSLGVGVVASLLILVFCQASHRVRIAVMTAAWAMLAVLMVGCFLPLPRLEVWQVSAPAISDGATSQAEGVLIAVWLAGATVAVGREVFGLLR